MNRLTVQEQSLASEMHSEPVHTRFDLRSALDQLRTKDIVHGNDLWVYSLAAEACERAIHSEEQVERLARKLKDLAEYWEQSAKESSKKHSVEVGCLRRSNAELDRLLTESKLENDKIRKAGVELFEQTERLRTKVEELEAMLGEPNAVPIMHEEASYEDNRPLGLVPGMSVTIDLFEGKIHILPADQ